jgi:hypothetical protein
VSFVFVAQIKFQVEDYLCPKAEMIKLSSVRCLSVCKEFLPRNPTQWDFFSKRKITPAERHHTTSKLANFAAVRAPPPQLLLAISQPKIKLQNRRSNPTGRHDSTHIAVARHRLSPPFASAQTSLLLASVFSIVPSSSRKLMMMV